MSQGPLAGLRIIDLSRVLSGPIATGLLADQGADVIKVEPLVGDVTRFGDEVSGTFVAANRGKRSIAVNLHAPEGIAIVKRLVEDADVFVQNFRPGAADGMGLGADVVRGINPRCTRRSAASAKSVRTPTSGSTIRSSRRCPGSPTCNRSVRPQAGLRSGHPGAVRARRPDTGRKRA